MGLAQRAPIALKRDAKTIRPTADTKELIRYVFPDFGPGDLSSGADQTLVTRKSVLKPKTRALQPACKRLLGPAFSIRFNARGQPPHDFLRRAVSHDGLPASWKKSFVRMFFIVSLTDYMCSTTKHTMVH